MRKKRFSNRKQNRKRLIHAAALMSLTMMILIQVPGSTYALMTSSAKSTSNFSSAFVFPKTVNELANLVKTQNATAIHFLELVREAYVQCQNANNSKVASRILNALEHKADAVDDAAKAAALLLAELYQYNSQAEKQLKSARENGMEDLASYEKVFKYVSAAYQNGKGSTKSAQDASALADRIIQEIRLLVAAMITDEQSKDDEEIKHNEIENEKKSEKMSEEEEDKKTEQESYGNKQRSNQPQNEGTKPVSDDTQEVQQPSEETSSAAESSQSDDIDLDISK
ncbi:hypothetical protein [Paenibacillus sp. Soil522]|uniref:hypothetical protein n=1 Tax=Paenibacillus sp. Soil522 TaxID=1736388 RepID=UPI0006F6D343|nr:hypothetical protein [Paenibacillus sp. Soil522]KRE51290.1 hypothetical protein ASG81_03785 [Paenibacillus sp. Soil522]